MSYGACGRLQDMQKSWSLKSREMALTRGTVCQTGYGDKWSLLWSKMRTRDSC